MTEAQYNPFICLLRALSHPPQPVTGKWTHNWRTGNILAALISEQLCFYLLMDVDDSGHSLALRISNEYPETDGKNIPEALDVSSIGVDEEELGFGTPYCEPLKQARCLHLDKIYFTIHLMATEPPVAHLSQASMTAIKIALIHCAQSTNGSIIYELRNPFYTNQFYTNPCYTNPFYTLPNESENSVSSEDFQISETDRLARFTEFVQNAYSLERLISIAYDTWDESDYDLIRLHLQRLKTMSDMQTARAEAENGVPVSNIVWDKLVRCAAKSRPGINPRDVFDNIVRNAYLLDSQCMSITCRLIV
jgi:hypothetical protein